MSKDERKLSKSEQKRKEKFEEIEQEYLRQGYEKNSITVSVIAANLWGILVPLPFFALLCWLFISLNQSSNFYKFSLTSMFAFLISFFVLIGFHEVIHGITWAIFAKNHFRSISFGLILKFLTPYCNCNEALTKAQYIIGALMPTIILGLIPAVIAAFIGNAVVFGLAILMLFGGGGDLLITLKMLLYKSNHRSCVYLDHPYEVGLVVFERAE